MVVRRTLKCTSCESRVITRTQLGHKDRQEHTFTCPYCGVRISFILDLNQKKGKWSFRKPQNAKWVNSEKGAVKVIAFSDEILVPTEMQSFSPFLETFSNFSSSKEFKAYRQDEGLRQGWVREVFPYCERCRIHYERGNWELFDKESPPSKGQHLSATNRLIDLYNCLQGGFSKFTLNTRGSHDRVMQRLTLAQTMAPALFAALTVKFLGSGRIRRLWTEIANVRRCFMENYDALQPLLQMRYWREDTRNPEAFKLSDKRFEALRQLYIDCFETLCRLLTLVVAVEAIIHHNSLLIPTRKESIDLDKFEQLKNSNKRDFIQKYPIGDMFLPVIDTDLRNGIGHNSAHYDPEFDLIMLYDTKDPGNITNYISYTEFCNRVLGLFGTFETGGNVSPYDSYFPRRSIVELLELVHVYQNPHSQPR